MTTNDDRRARLPKWAQQELDRLAGDVAYWKAKATAGPLESDTFVENYVGPSRPLGQRPHIRFRLGPRRWIEARLSEDGEVVVRSDGGDHLGVLPSASNSIRLRLLPYHE